MVPASQHSRERNNVDIFKIMIIKGNLFTLHSLHMKTARHCSLLEFITMQAVICCGFSGSLCHSSFSSVVSHRLRLFVQARASISD